MYLNLESVFFCSCFYYISQYEIKTISIIDDFSKNNIEMVFKLHNRYLSTIFPLTDFAESLLKHKLFISIHLIFLVELIFYKKLTHMNNYVYLAGPNCCKGSFLCLVPIGVFMLTSYMLSILTI